MVPAWALRSVASNVKSGQCRFLLWGLALVPGRVVTGLPALIVRQGARVERQSRKTCTSRSKLCVRCVCWPREYNNQVLSGDAGCREDVSADVTGGKWTVAIETRRTIEGGSGGSSPTRYRWREGVVYATEKGKRTSREKPCKAVYRRRTLSERRRGGRKRGRTRSTVSGERRNDGDGGGEKKDQTRSS